MVGIINAGKTAKSFSKQINGCTDFMFLGLVSIDPAVLLKSDKTSPVVVSADIIADEAEYFPAISVILPGRQRVTGGNIFADVYLTVPGAQHGIFLVKLVTHV